MSRDEDKQESRINTGGTAPGRLSPEKRALLASRLRKLTSPRSRAPGIARRADPASFPLSFAQERFWFLEQLEPDVPTNHSTAHLRLAGELDLRALHEALNEILRRHSVLRAAFPSEAGCPRQAIRPCTPCVLPLTDLSALAPDAREVALRDLALRIARDPFDIATDPLFRMALVQLDVRQHVLLLVFHHLVFDGWSAGVLQQELEQCYRCVRSGDARPLPDLALEYADYAAWQRQCLEAGVWDEDLQYWRNELAEPLAILELPMARPRAAQPRYQAASLSLDVSAPLMAQLQALCQREQVTLFMLLLAAYQALLYRYSGQEDLTVGCPIAGRTQVETEPLIGCFINTLALRASVQADMPFRELLKRVRDKSLAALGHQGVPFEKIVEAVNPARSLNRAPIFQTVLNFRNFPTPARETAELVVSRCHFGWVAAPVDLTLEIEEQSGSLSCSWLYDADLFDAQTIARMADHYRTLLSGIVTDAETKVGDLPLLSAAERQQLLVEWNATAVDYPRDKCVHELFEEQAARTPQTVAVVCGEQQLTYAELNARANQVAHALRRRGVGPDQLVGVCLDRSPDLVVALLGILKAGGAYLPLEPDYPRDRLAFLLQDSRPSLILSQTTLRDRLPADASVFCMDQMATIDAGEHAGAPPKVRGEQLAYVLYTSGSTGLPKAVMIPHRALANHMFWMQEQFPVTPDDTVLQRTSYSFDASVWEFLLPLMSGARLALVQPDGTRDLDQIIQLIQRERVTVAQFVPSLLDLFLQHPQAGACASLRRVFCGGEALPRELCERFRDSPGAELVNLYGPTETTIDAVFWVYEPLLGHRQPPIGRPVANTQVYVLDAQRQPVPVGVPGELYIGGRQVGRGYLNRPELTAERFLDDPFGCEPGARLYRTGDRVRWLPEGTLEFLGRFDDQVKLRGHRIELGEIETVLREHPAVARCVVQLREDHPGGKRLIGYYVVSSGQAANAAELKRHLRAQLPDYMVPASFQELSQLPLTPSGKVDRRALPAPDERRPEMESAYVAPRDALEEQLTAIWAELLRVERVGVHDNFFALGGHSLLVMRAATRINQNCHVLLPLRTIFESPTVAGVAVAVRNLQGTQVSTAGPQVRVAKINRDLQRRRRPPTS